MASPFPQTIDGPIHGNPIPRDASTFQGCGRSNLFDPGRRLRMRRRWCGDEPIKLRRSFHAISEFQGNVSNCGVSTKHQLKNNWMKFLVSSCFCSFPIFSFVPTSTIFGHIQSQGYGRVLKRLRVPTTMVSHLSLAFCYRKRVEGSGLSPKSMHETFQVPKMEALTYISCM